VKVFERGIVRMTGSLIKDNYLLFKLPFGVDLEITENDSKRMVNCGICHVDQKLPEYALGSVIYRIMT
jgi:hypothetical protein